MVILASAPSKITKNIMNYFELYYAYLTWCERDNWLNMRDPNHDYMEWNHTLPQCIFGDQPVGQWLTKKQHAIASALQTLAFGKLCMCPWHKDFMPATLWELANTCVLQERQKYGAMAGKISGPLVGARLYAEGKGLFDLKYAHLKSGWSRKGVETQRTEGIGLFDPEVRANCHDAYVENGIREGIRSLENKTGLFDEKYDDRRQEWASNAGKIGGRVTGRIVVEKKIGICDPANADKVKEGQRKGRETTNKQRWQSTLDGFISTAAGVASHNRSIGGTGKDKVKLTD